MKRYFIALFTLLALAFSTVALAPTATPLASAQDDDFCIEFPDDPDCQDDDGSDAGPSDADGDGYPIPFDQCPETPGNANLDGCPEEGDEDNDGIPNDRDACLFEAGPESNDGCPTGDTTGDAPLPDLPTDVDECVIATDGAYQVNVRAEPDANTQVVSVLEPSETYTVSRQSENGEWFYIEPLEGWVAARVVRTNDNCASTLSAPAAVTSTPTPSFSVYIVTIRSAVNGAWAPNPPGYQTIPGADLDWLHAVHIKGTDPVEVTQVIGANNTDVSANCRPSLPATIQPSGTSPQIFCLQTTSAQRGQQIIESNVNGRTVQHGTSLRASDFTYYEAFNFVEDPLAQLQILSTVDGNPAPLPPGYNTTTNNTLNWEHTVTNLGNADATVDIVFGANGTNVSANCTPSLPVTLPANSSNQIECTQTTNAQQGQNLRMSIVGGEGAATDRRLIDTDYTNYIAQDGDDPSDDGQTGSGPDPTGLARADALAVFETNVLDADQTDVYLLRGSTVEPLATDPDLNENAPALSPSGDRAAYLKTEADGTTRVLVEDINEDTITPVLRETDPNSDTPIEIANWAPTWTPDGDQLLVTLIAEDGVSEVHRVAADGSTLESPQLVVSNARQPVHAQNGEEIAFVRGGDIHTYTVETGNVQSITDPADRTTCVAPVYGPNAQSLYFTCDSDLYQNTDDGPRPVNITGATTTENPQVASILGAYWFDDGADIFLGTTTQRDVLTLIDFDDQDAYRFHTPYLR